MRDNRGLEPGALSVLPQTRWSGDAFWRNFTASAGARPDNKPNCRLQLGVVTVLKRPSPAPVSMALVHNAQRRVVNGDYTEQKLQEFTVGFPRRINPQSVLDRGLRSNLLPKLPIITLSIRQLYFEIDLVCETIGMAEHPSKII